ncbi:hypothetical protein SDC9_188344 [bioreactor metagenome]|uniref:Uncharacterized protein n=1 Tax=bioreactor metagenome TaxID=1076179 RepID=A0A645HP25_9ZZZZ
MSMRKADLLQKKLTFLLVVDASIKNLLCFTEQMLKVVRLKSSLLKKLFLIDFAAAQGSMTDVKLWIYLHTLSLWQIQQMILRLSVLLMFLKEELGIHQ